MTQATPFRARIGERLSCDVVISACTTLETRPARIADLSPQGAQVRMDEPYAQGERIHLDIDGDFVWAQVQWAEIDRMGVKFVAPLTDDHPLLRQVRLQHRRQAAQAARPPSAVRGFGRRAA